MVASRPKVSFDQLAATVPEITGGLFVVDDSLCGLVVRVLGYRSGGPGSISGTTRKKYWVWNRVHSAS
jgi:hypothetical protein